MADPPRPVALLLASLPARPAAAAPADLFGRLREGGLVLLLRHARTEPGTGDPPDFRLGDCSTQRSLDAAGRKQARAIGARLRVERVPVGRVLTSEWCRCRETAELMAVGPVEAAEAINSFFEERSRRDEQTRAARALAAAWGGPGNLVLVIPQVVNVTAFTVHRPARWPTDSGSDVRCQRFGRAPPSARPER
jgi:phosphohistidine phosphatase SixA